MVRASNRRRPMTCHHEAGHALARWYFGHRTDHAVVFTPAEVWAGVQIETRRGWHSTCEGIVDGYDICSYPFGPLNVSSEYPEQGAELNRLRSISRDVDLINCLAGFYAEAAYRRASVAECMFAGGAGDMKHLRIILDAWPMSEAERNDLCREAEARAAALVRSRMGAAAIRAVADRLLARGYLDGDEIASLCRSAYGDRECAFGAWSHHWPPSLAQIRSGHIPPPPDASRAVA